MKIAVCVKVVLPRTPNLRLDLEASRLVPTGPGALNPLDRCAVEEALRIKGRREVSEIVVVALTAAANLAPVRESLAMGADRAIVVSDPAAEGSDLLAASAALAAALRREAPDLVLLGGQSEDGNGATMPAALAERLGLPLLSQAVSLSLEGDVATGQRQTEQGYETLGMSLPCVVAVADGLNIARYATPKGMIEARRKPVALVTAADLGIDPSELGVSGSRTVVFRLSNPPARPEPRRLSGASAAEELVAFLVEREFAA